MQRATFENSPTGHINNVTGPGLRIALAYSFLYHYRNLTQFKAEMLALVIKATYKDESMLTKRMFRFFRYRIYSINRPGRAY